MRASGPWPGRPWPRPGCPRTGQADAWCDACLFFQSLGAGAPEDYQALAARLKALEKGHHFPGNRLFYLALPPEACGPAIAGLGQAKLNHSPGWTRLVVEKPFGRDLESAHNLNQLLHRHFEESQIYRIDHYLGKETVQNLLIFRFANDIFEPLWHRNLVQSVQITVAESNGVGGRGGYYEQTGALRDMVQNHLTQLLTLTAMEVPVAFEPEAIRSEKAKVLRAIAPVRPEDVVYGQYTRGVVAGQEVPGYREEPGVAPDSATETFVALKLGIDNWRWQGVPFYLVTGKRLPAKLHPDRRHLPLPAGVALPADADLLQPQRPGLHPAAGRRLRPPLSGQGPGGAPGPEDPTPALPLRRGLRAPAGRLRDPARRRHGRGPDPVRPGRRSRGGLAHLRPACWPSPRPSALLSRRLLRPPGRGPPHGMAGPGFTLPLNL